MSEILTVVRQFLREKGGERQPEKLQRPAGMQTSARRSRKLCGGAEPAPQQEQLELYAGAFDGLARLFHSLPCQRERLNDGELREIFERVREQACAGCEREQTCWEDELLQNCGLLYERLCGLEGQKKAEKKTGYVPGGFCRREDRIEAALREGYEEARQTLFWENRMLEQRQAAGEQIAQTAELLRQLAQGFSEAPVRERQLLPKLGRELRWLDIELNRIHIFACESGRTEIYLTLRTRRGSAVSAKEVAQALSDCCGERMRPAFNCRAAVSDEPSLFHFVPDTRYQMFCGIARITKAGELVSGDNYTFLEKDTGKVAMSLADGMGSGAGACEESEKVIELVEQFLTAGFPQETAVRMINSCLLLQNSRRMFSTIDLCMVDLYNANCDLIKSGAAPTYLWNGSGIEVIRSDTFPAGLMQQADYTSLHRRLDAGSCIIMTTDGVPEALPVPNREEEMTRLIRACRMQNAQEFARRLLERVYLMQRLQARDDMTILVGTLWRKA